MTSYEKGMKKQQNLQISWGIKLVKSAVAQGFLRGLGVQLFLQLFKFCKIGAVFVKKQMGFTISCATFSMKKDAKKCCGTGIFEGSKGATLKATMRNKRGQQGV
jgi:hypothetical protein